MSGSPFYALCRVPVYDDLTVARGGEDPRVREELKARLMACAFGAWEVEQQWMGDPDWDFEIDLETQAAMPKWQRKTQEWLLDALSHAFFEPDRDVCSLCIDPRGTEAKDRYGPTSDYFVMVVGYGDDPPDLYNELNIFDTLGITEAPMPFGPPPSPPCDEHTAANNSEPPDGSEGGSP